MISRQTFAIWLYESHRCTSRTLFRLLDGNGDAREWLFGKALSQKMDFKIPAINLEFECYESFWREREATFPHQVTTLSFWDEAYPETLKQIYDPPIILYMTGNKSLLDCPLTIGMVGTRNPSEYGKKAAYSIAKDLSAVGVCIVSGFAMGIDACAHSGAVEHSNTIAVLGCGIDLNYPVVNLNLRRKILEKGLLISEFPLGTRAQSFHFPMRNRIISGLSKGVVVVEAAPKSGSLITARLALEQNRDVFAVPGEVYKAKSQGCNQLIRDGATLIQCGTDVLSYYGINRVEVVQKPQLSSKQAPLYQLIEENGPITFDQLFEKSSMEMGELMLELFQMEMLGVIEQQMGSEYTVK